MTNSAINTLMSSSVMTYSTPQWLFGELNREYKFTIDLAADKSNHKCSDYFTESDDALSQDWHTSSNNGFCWLNPPYGRHLYVWMKKVAEEAQKGAKIVCLIPARTDTKYWHDFIFGNKDVYKITFIKGRLKFSGNKNSAPFPSVLIEFNRQNNEFKPIINTINNF